VGVVTYDADALGARHFAAVGVAPDTPVIGLPRDGALHGLIERGEQLRLKDVEREVVESVRQMLTARPDVGAIVLECTNLPPYAAAVRRTFDIPVFDVVTMGSWFYGGLVERHFARTISEGPA